MGWTYQFKERSMTIADFFRKEFERKKTDGVCSSLRILDCATKMRVAYLAIEINDADGKVSRFALVCLLGYRPRDHFNFVYKDMDESMGPYYYDCPARILDLLEGFPPANEDAAEWRRRCREKLATPRKSLPQPGQVIQFDHAVRFTNGEVGRLFKVVKKGRRGIMFYEKNGYFAARITRQFLVDHDWQVVQTQQKEAAL